MSKKRSRPSSRKQRTVTGRAGRRRAASARPLITTAVFDLDDTLYDCYGQRVLAAHRHAAAAMVRAGLPATPARVLRLRLRAFRRDPRISRIDPEICRHFRIAHPEKILQAARQAFFTLPVGRLRLFPASLRVLRTLHRAGVRIFVVSFGDPFTQHAKVRALGLHREPAVERIFYADTAHLVTKEGVFRSLLRHVEPDPKRILVVGDRPSSEIRAGKLLGMHTARLLHGEFLGLKPAGPEEKADFTLRDIAGVLRLPLRFGKAD
ncbi:MAG TPA: HAD family hydrolase [Terriglobales bacterium]|nr:HAD family hydrolase [Terriglobales bacterium]